MLEEVGTGTQDVLVEEVVGLAVVDMVVGQAYTDVVPEGLAGPMGGFLDLQSLFEQWPPLQEFEQ